MNAARLADESPEVEKLAPAAVRALAAPNTPETVRSDVVADIKTGNVPSTKTVKAKIAEAAVGTAARQASRDAIARQVKNEVTTKLATTAAGIRKIMADAVADAVSGDDLVERLRAAGLDAARAAFEAAFPGYVVTDLDELEAEISKAKAA